MALKILFYFVTLFKFQADLCRVVTVGPKRFPIEMYRPNRRSPNAMAALIIFCKVPGYPLNFSFDFIQ